MISAREGYDLWAETWDKTPSPIVAVEERLLRPWIDALHPHRPLDIGCGTGRWTQRLSAVGFDISPAMLAVAARKPGLAGRLAAADATALPIATAAADLLLCTLTLGHVPDRARALREFARVLRPAGTLILTDFHPDAAARGWRRTFRRDGRVYELEHHTYALQDIAGDFVLEETCDGVIDEPERHLFVAAGRAELFAEACAVPVVQLSRWRRV